MKTSGPLRLRSLQLSATYEHLPEESPPEHPADTEPSAEPTRPSAIEKIQDTPVSERRQFNVGVPEFLRLHRRAGLYAEDHGLSRQDQVAVALDAWLRERGY